METSSSPAAHPPSANLLNMNDFSLNIDYASPAPEGLLVPQSSAAKQPKKRKSWGQALPEPKTSLPPRKRAKTDDEKEQRRIERIKRNRAAAHNSRERKRVEAERLEVENIRLKHQLAMMQQHLLRQDAQLAEFQRLAPNTLPQLSSEEFASLDFNSFPEIKDESSSVGTPASSTGTIDPRASFSESTPHEDMSTPFIKAESPCTSIMMATPTSAPANGAKLDLTQHSAAMLCDLPCQSSRQSLKLAVNGWWAQLILYLMHLNIMACYKTLLAVSWTLWPARIARILELTSASQRQTTSSTTCLRKTTTSSRTTRPTTTTTPRSMTRRLRQQRSSALSATSTTPSSLLSYLSLLLQSQTSAQSIATGPRPEGASAATRLALLSQLAEQRNGLVSGSASTMIGAGFSHLHGGGRLGRRRSGNSSCRDSHQEEGDQGNGNHDDGGVG